MKTLLCVIHCIAGVLFASVVSAQSLQYPHSPLFIGTGAYSQRFSNLFSFLSNTAALAMSKGISAGVYSENKFGLKELNHYTAAVSSPIGGNGGIGIVTTYAGSKELNESQIGLAYGKNLGKINIGARFNYTLLRTSGYGSDGAISFELGSTWKISEKLYTGIQIVNPVGGKFGEESKEKLPSVYSVGAGYECSEQFYIGVDIVKEESKPVNLRATLQYIIARRLITMLGINSGTSSPALCAGWQWKNMRVLINGSFHPQLGATTGLAIIFFEKMKED